MHVYSYFQLRSIAALLFRQYEHIMCGISCVHLRQSVLHVGKDATLKTKVTEGTEFLAEAGRGLMSLGTEMTSKNMVHGTYFF